MKYTVRHRVVTDYLREVEAESEEEAIQIAKGIPVNCLDPNETVDLGWTVDVEDQNEEVSK